MLEEIESSMIGPLGAGVFRSNVEIRDEVWESICLDDTIRHKDIDLSVEGGVVTLRGRVNSDVAKAKCESIAREVLGVMDVRNDLEVTR
jgi:osmotically-inducible protein OsmY